MKKGYLVSFEGGDGCGKSTQIKIFCRQLEENGIEYVVSREPGGTSVAQKTRELLLSNKEEMSQMVELLLFSAARADHVDKIVRPALQDGKVVVLDRYYDSTYAYQGTAGKISFEQISEITDLAVGECKPDLTFVLDISYEEAFSRKAKDENLKNLDRIESKGKQYHEKVRQGYFKVAELFKERVVMIDASKNIEAISKDIWQEFKKRY